VKRNLVNIIEPVDSGDGWLEERTGLHRREFIETRRHWFDAPVPHATDGSVQVLNLCQGEEAIVESPRMHSTAGGSLRGKRSSFRRPSDRIAFAARTLRRQKVRNDQSVCPHWSVKNWRLIEYGHASTGFLLLVVAGVLTPLFALPMKFTRRWAWENTWPVWSVLALLLLPLIAAVITVPQLSHVYAQQARARRAS